MIGYINTLSNDVGTFFSSFFNQLKGKLKALSWCVTVA